MNASQKPASKQAETMRTLSDRLEQSLVGDERGEAHRVLHTCCCFDDTALTFDGDDRSAHVREHPDRRADREQVRNGFERHTHMMPT